MDAGFQMDGQGGRIASGMIRRFADGLGTDHKHGHELKHEEKVAAEA